MMIREAYNKATEPRQELSGSERKVYQGWMPLSGKNRLFESLLM